MAQAQKKTTTHETVESPETDASILESLGINGQLFLFQLINFGIVMLIVWFLILKPLTKKMEERKQKIDESLENAERVQTNLKMSEQKYQEKIDEAKAGANAIMRHAHEEAEGLAKKINERAKRDVEHVVDEARQAIFKERESMKNELKKETGALVVMALQKILETDKNAETQKQLAEKFIHALEKKI